MKKVFLGLVILLVLPLFFLWGCITTSGETLPTESENDNGKTEELVSEEGGIVTDFDGNVYKTVIIGNQVWMLENLKVTHYNNGDSIPNIDKRSEWVNLTTGAYCDFDNNTENSEKFGHLYNWYAITDSRGVTPEGWHVPTNEDWETLVNYLGGNNIAGGKLKEAGTDNWHRPNQGANNESGFTALPTGYRFRDGIFNNLGVSTNFWSDTEFNEKSAWGRYLGYDLVVMNSSNYSKINGMAVRLIKD